MKVFFEKKFLKHFILITSLTLGTNFSSSPSSYSAVKSAQCFYMSYGETSALATGATFNASLSSNCSELIHYQIRYLNVSLVIQGVPVGFAYVQGPIRQIPINVFMNLSFSLLSPGNYPAFISIIDDSGFVWQSPAGTINIPKASSNRTNSKFACVSASNFETSCQIYPDWSFEFCSKLSIGSVQEFVGGKWKKLWNVDGSEDLSTCDEEFPYLVEVSGTTSLATGKKSKMRVFFKGTQFNPSFSQAFTISIKR